MNQASALRVRSKSELSEADYRGFYRHINGDYNNPLTWVHSKVEGTYEYTLLLFVPSRSLRHVDPAARPGRQAAYPPGLRAGGQRPADAAVLRFVVSRMKEGQKDIYYLLAPSLAAAVASPHLEAFRKKGVEVLLLGEDVDNWMISNLRESDGKRLQSVAQGVADLGELEDKAEAEAKEQASTVLSGLVSQLKAVLAGQAWDVRVTSRLTTSPACIAANEPENASSLARRLRGSGLPIQPVLEINPRHPLVQRLNREPADPRLAEWAHVLYNQAMLTLAARIQDPSAFAGRLNDQLVNLTDQTDGVDEAQTGEADETTGEADETEPDQPAT